MIFHLVGNVWCSTTTVVAFDEDENIHWNDFVGNRKRVIVWKIDIFLNAWHLCCINSIVVLLLFGCNSFVVLMHL